LPPCQILRLKCIKIQFQLVLCPRSCWGIYSAPPNFLAGLKGPTSKGRDRRRRREKDEIGGEGKERRRGKCCGVQKIFKINLALILRIHVFCRKKLTAS